MNKDVKRVMNVTYCGVVGACLGPLLGWVLSGLNDLKYYLTHSVEQVVVWAIIGLFVGNVIQVVLEKLDVIGKRGGGKDDESKSE